MHHHCHNPCCCHPHPIYWNGWHHPIPVAIPVAPVIVIQPAPQVVVVQPHIDPAHRAARRHRKTIARLAG